MRKIIHVDMDAFYASIEQRDHPELKGIPIAVGFDSSRGVVATASYEARRYGVHSAMSVVRAKQLCPQLTIVHTHHEYYEEISAQIHDIFRRYTDLIEPISIDEAFLDVTKYVAHYEDAQNIAAQIKNDIVRTLSLTASAGVSYNKFLAKIASDLHKPDGLTLIHPDAAQEFINTLPIEKFWGIGRSTTKRMHSMGIFSGAQLKKVSLNHLVEVFGKAGEVYYNFARGIDQRCVVNSHIRKSVGCEETFLEDLTLSSQAIIHLYHLVVDLEQRIEQACFMGYTLTLKVKYSDFTTISRSYTATVPFKEKQQLLIHGKQLLKSVPLSIHHSIRLIGLSVSNPHTPHPQWKEGWLPFETDEK